MKLKLIWFCIMLNVFPFYLFAQEIHVRRGNAGDFPTEFQGKREGDGLFFGMSDLPPGRIINLTRPELVTAGQRRVTGQILVVKQIPSQGRLRSSEIILSPQGADYFGVRSELFLVTNNSSVRWADNMPPLPPPLPSWPQVGQDQSAQQQQQPQQQYYPSQQQQPQQYYPQQQPQYPNQQQYYPQQQQPQQYPPQPPQQQQAPQQQPPAQQQPQEEPQQQQQPPAVARFRKSTVEEYDYRMFGNGELEYELEPAEVRPPEETVTVNDVVDELEQTGSSIKKNRPSKKKAAEPEKEPEKKPTPVPQENIDFVEQEPQKLEIDVNVGVAEPPAPVMPEVPVQQPSLPVVEPYQEVDAAFRSRLQAKTISPVQPGLYIQVGYFGQQQSLVKTFLAVEKWFDVKIVPSTENGQRFYRLLVGSFRDDELGLARENLRKLGLKDFFLVRY